MRVTGRECGVFGEPAGVTGMAGLTKLCREGKIPADASVVAIVTGNGLKDTANGIKAAGEPIRLEPDIEKFRAVYEELNK
jgi:threonine synthase